MWKRKISLEVMGREIFISWVEKEMKIVYREYGARVV